MKIQADSSFWNKFQQLSFQYGRNLALTAKKIGFWMMMTQNGENEKAHFEKVRDLN